MYPKCVSELIEIFKMFPGVGDKSAERMVFSLLEFSGFQLDSLMQNISVLKNEVCFCSKCGFLVENNKCLFCTDDSRDKSKLLITAKIKDVFTFEKLGKFNGLYFVLKGLISPINQIGPNDIGIDNLINLIKENNVLEVVFALKSTVEGETTMLYISKMLSQLNVKVSKIAVGIPIGSDFEFIDNMTLQFAFEERSSFI